MWPQECLQASFQSRQSTCLDNLKLKGHLQQIRLSLGVQRVWSLLRWREGFFYRLQCNFCCSNYWLIYIYYSKQICKISPILWLKFDLRKIKVFLKFFKKNTKLLIQILSTMKHRNCNYLKLSIVWSKFIWWWLFYKHY